MEAPLLDARGLWSGKYFGVKKILVFWKFFVNFVVEYTQIHSNFGTNISSYRLSA